MAKIKNEVRAADVSADELLAEVAEPKAWAPPTRLVGGIDDVIRHNLKTADNRRKVGPEKLATWCAKHGCVVGVKTLARYVKARASVLSPT